MKKTVYVTYQVSNGGLEHDVINIDGKVNHYTVEKAIKDTLSYYRSHEAITVISWSLEEEFTSEEMSDFWKNY